VHDNGQIMPSANTDVIFDQQRWDDVWHSCATTLPATSGRLQNQFSFGHAPLSFKVPLLRQLQISWKS
jgi:hypothetical protein